MYWAFGYRSNSLGPPDETALRWLGHVGPAHYLGHVGPAHYLHPDPAIRYAEIAKKNKKSPLTFPLNPCKENGPLAHLLWILVFDVQHNQIGLMNL